MSAVWVDPETNNRIVVMGITGKANLDDWKPVRAYELSEKEAKTYIGSKYTVYPADSEDPFVQQKKGEFDGKAGESED